jgi:predicted nucleic acid-binding protein
MVKVARKSSVYLDVCSLCRPFDNQKFARIRLETEAVNLILENVKTGEMIMIISPVHYEEIKATSDNIERIEIFSLFNNYGEMIKANIEETRNRAGYLYDSGFGIADAAHIAFAEAACADFVTCDDRLLKKCLKMRLKIWCGNPLQYCLKENLK